MADGTQDHVSGTASDTGGGVVAGVEVSTDGGTHAGIRHRHDELDLLLGRARQPRRRSRIRAADDSGNIQTPGRREPGQRHLPLLAVGQPGDPRDPRLAAIPTRPRSASSSGPTPTARSRGIRFYKSAANTGTHMGSLWTAGGQRLAQATFTERDRHRLADRHVRQPGRVTPDTTYVASYYAPNGHFAITPAYFYPPPAPGPNGGSTVDSPPLHALRNAGTTTNGVFAYTAPSTFPVDSFNATNYWVDVQLHTDRRARSGDRRDATRRRPHVGERLVDGALDGWHADLLPDHALRRLDGADAEDDHRHAAGHEQHGHRAHPGHDLHVQGPGDQPDGHRARSRPPPTP